jgi:hypothetical protein
MPERRQHKRFDLEYTIQLISEDGDMVITAITTNISNGGLRLPLPVECLPDQQEEIQVNLTIRRRLTAQIENYSGFAGIVRHTDPDEDGMVEVALEFCQPLRLHLEEEARAAAAAASEAEL